MRTEAQSEREAVLKERRERIATVVMGAFAGPGSHLSQPNGWAAARAAVAWADALIDVLDAK